MSVPLFLGRNAEHAVPKPRRGGFTLAQGKRSAALGHDANILWPEGPLQKNGRAKPMFTGLYLNFAYSTATSG